MKLSLNCISVQPCLCHFRKISSVQWQNSLNPRVNFLAGPAIENVSATTENCELDRKRTEEQRNKEKKCRPHPQPLARRRLYLLEEDGEDSSGTGLKAGDTDWHFVR